MITMVSEARIARRIITKKNFTNMNKDEYGTFFGLSMDANEDLIYINKAMVSVLNNKHSTFIYKVKDLLDLPEPHYIFFRTQKEKLM